MANVSRGLFRGVWCLAWVCLGGCGAGVQQVLIVDYPTLAAEAAPADAGGTPAAEPKSQVGAKASSGGQPGAGGQAAPTPKGNCMTPDHRDMFCRYWSAYAYIDPRNIGEVWELGAADYALIVAKATIPTATGPLVREFPLFTVEGGTLQVHSGVDLLKKVPILIDRRDQVSFTLEVTHFDTPELLAEARKVLARTAELAEPFLGNYGVASQIIGGATRIIDDMTPEEQRKKNSYRNPIIPEDLQRTSRQLRTWFMFSSKQTDGPDRLGARVFRPCEGHPGALCEHGTNFARNRVKDLVYVAIELRAYENVFDQASLVTDGVCHNITSERIQAAREYLDANASLFHPDDVQIARKAYAAGASLIAARALRDRGALGDLADHLYLGDFSTMDFGIVPEGALHRQLHEIELCVLREVFDESPMREAFRLAQLQRLGGQLQCTGHASASACRTDAQIAALERLAALSRVDYQPNDPRALEGMPGSVLKLTVGEVRAALAHDKQAAADLTSAACATRDDATALLGRFSLACEDCLAATRRVCGALGKGEFEALVARERVDRANARLPN